MQEQNTSDKQKKVTSIAACVERTQKMQERYGDYEHELPRQTTRPNKENINAYTANKQAEGQGATKDLEQRPK